MNYKPIVLNKKLTDVENANIIEVQRGHRYIMGNRYTDGFEDIQFLRIMTYKEMLENNLQEDFINAQVPESERDCDNCNYYVVNEGVYTQDVASVLEMRLDFQYEWLKNGFYKNAKSHATGIKDAFSRFEDFRISFGFYHKPFTKEKFIENLEEKNDIFVLGKKGIINEFFEIETEWQTKEELIKLI